MRKFRSQGEHAPWERVLNIARLGKRRGMISRNNRWKLLSAPKKKRSRLVPHWLETPDASSIGGRSEAVGGIRAKFPQLESQE